MLDATFFHIGIPLRKKMSRVDLRAFLFMLVFQVSSTDSGVKGMHPFYRWFISMLVFDVALP
jgi:hypothetical protein